MEDATFADGAGRRWTIKLTIGLLDDLDQIHQLNLLSDSALGEISEEDAAPLTTLLMVPSKLAKVLWTCVARQAEHKEVSKDDFINELGGEELTEGFNAMKSAIVNFTRSQSPARAAALEALYNAEIDAMDRHAEQVTKVLQSEMTREAMEESLQKMEEVLEQTLKKNLRKANDKLRSA